MDVYNSNGIDHHHEINQHLLLDDSTKSEEKLAGGSGGLTVEILNESKKIWHIVGPTLISRLANASMNIVTGHLGEVELTSVSIANNVIVGFNWDLLLGMASALETLCGQAFGAKKYSILWSFLSYLLLGVVMLCLENWYYRILIIMTEFFENAKLAVDSFSICMAINGWEMMFAVSFFAGIGVRVANELGAGNGNTAKFSTKVCVIQSTIIGLVFFALVLIFPEKLALIFTISDEVVDAVNKLAFLLACSILLNSVQPVLSGVAIGSGWQSWVAWINIFCYYVVGLPIGVLMGWVFNWGTEGVWGGLIFGGTAIQTIILMIVTTRTNWEYEVEKADMRVKKWSNHDKA